MMVHNWTSMYVKIQLSLNTLFPFLLRKGVKVEVRRTETGSLRHSVTQTRRYHGR